MRQRRAYLGAALLAICLLAVSDGQAGEVRSPVAGSWKMSVYLQGQDIALAIIRVEVKDGKAEAVVVATGARTFTRARVEQVTAGERSLHLLFKTPTSTFQVAAYGRKDERRPRVLLGSFEVRNNVEAVTLERTTEKDLDKDNPATPAEGADELKKLKTTDDKERAQVLKAILEKQAGKPVALAAAERVWQHYGRDEYAVKNERDAGEDYVRSAAGFGREMELYASTRVAIGLAAKKDGANEAVRFARRAEKLLTESDPAPRSIVVLKTLAFALRRTDAGNEAARRELKETIAKLDDQLDVEFEKSAIPFKPEAFAGRKNKSSRVAVVELFAGAQCPACVAADIAFDALLKAYKPAEVILLQYHLHVPRPDPLTNLDGELRSAVYHVEGTPTIFLNGKEVPGLGGSVKEAEESYLVMTRLVDKALEGETRAGLNLDVKRAGDKITATATLTSLTSKNAARLHVLLVEDVVRYPGSNGQRLHRHVVRAVIGDVEARLPKGAAAPQTFSVSVKEVRSKLADYLEKSNKETPFLDEERPLNLQRLKIVALIQEKESKEILHAVQVDVPEGK